MRFFAASALRPAVPRERASLLPPFIHCPHCHGVAQEQQVSRDEQLVELDELPVLTEYSCLACGRAHALVTGPSGRKLLPVSRAPTDGEREQYKPLRLPVYTPPQEGDPLP